MAEETKFVTTKTIGFSFGISVEKESRKETGAKYPDKIVAKATLSGHADTFEAAKTLLEEATKEVKKHLDEVK